MKKAFAVLGSLLAFSFIGASALAAGPEGVTTSVDGRTAASATTIPRSLVVPYQSHFNTEGLTEVYSTFNSDTSNTYDCCSGWTVSARDSVLAMRQAVAMPFTPAADANVTKIGVAVGYVTGVNGVSVALYSDSAGLPGEVIERFKVSGLPTFGECCVTESVHLKGVPVAAGTQYWVVVKTGKIGDATWSAWNFNSISAVGPFAFNQGGGWQLTDSNLGAFNVLAK